MLINKIGTQHLDIGMNCQDYGVEKDGLKLVCDGCSEGEHSEVGAKTFCHLIENESILCNGVIESIFGRLCNLFGQTITTIKNFLCFTILCVQEDDENFRLIYCGDGYVILEDLEGNISFEELNDGEYPKYYAYNYCDPNKLKHYKDGVTMTEKLYSKTEYKNVGVASDGIRFILKTNDTELKSEFIELLKTGKAVKIKRFINRNQKLFKDDTTIVF